MLKQRVITALALLLVLLPALFYQDPAPFCLLALIFVACAAWEWARINGYSGGTALLTGGVCATIGAGLWIYGAPKADLGGIWLAAGLFWVLGGTWVLWSGVAKWSGYPRFLRLCAGLLVLCVTWLAIAQAKLIGINFLLSVLALVWGADIAAYFAGRAFGGRVIRRKLAVSISPGKSWEGALGGAASVTLMAFVWCEADQTWALASPSLYSLVGRQGTGVLVVVAVFLAGMSVVGDLFESLVKRSAGVKDSSNLLPGHGGVLDRIDALLPTLPLAMLFYSWRVAS
jgi:phosphatidate cytidylyltransferase